MNARTQLSHRPPPLRRDAGAGGGRPGGHRKHVAAMAGPHHGRHPRCIAQGARGVAARRLLLPESAHGQRPGHRRVPRHQRRDPGGRVGHPRRRGRADAADRRHVAGARVADDAGASIGRPRLKRRRRCLTSGSATRASHPKAAGASRPISGSWRTTPARPRGSAVRCSGLRSWTMRFATCASPQCCSSASATRSEAAFRAMAARRRPAAPFALSSWA